MFGQGFFVGKAVRWVATNLFDADEESAVALGLVAGVAVSIATLDPAGAGTLTVEKLGSQAALDAVRDKLLDM